MSDYELLSRGWARRNACGPTPEMFNAAAGTGGNDTAAILAAINALEDGGTIYLRPTTYNVDAITWPLDRHNITFEGAGDKATFLKANPGINTNFITATAHRRLGFRDLTIDGNRANQSAGHALAVAVIGHDFSNLSVINAKEKGILHTAPGIPYYPNQEGSYYYVRIADSGKEGLDFQGPTDCNFDHVIVSDASLEADNTYDSFRLIGCRARHLHAWTRPETTNKARYACNLTGTGAPHLTQCHFENGKSAQLFVDSTVNSAFISDSLLYYPIANTTEMVKILSNNGVMSGCKVNGDTQYAGLKGIVLGDATYKPKGWQIRANVSNCRAGRIDYTNEGGYNIIEITGENPSGATDAVGSMAATDVGVRMSHTGAVSRVAQYT